MTTSWWRRQLHAREDFVWFLLVVLILLSAALGFLYARFLYPLAMENEFRLRQQFSEPSREYDRMQKLLE